MTHKSLILSIVLIGLFQQQFHVDCFSPNIDSTNTAHIGKPPPYRPVVQQQQQQRRSCTVSNSATAETTTSSRSCQQHVSVVSRVIGKPPQQTVEVNQIHTTSYPTIDVTNIGDTSTLLSMPSVDSVSTPRYTLDNDVFYSNGTMMNSMNDKDEVDNVESDEERRAIPSVQAIFCGYSSSLEEKIRLKSANV